MMNVERFIQLRQAVKDCPPERFDYGSVSSSCGCVMPIAERLWPDDYRPGVDLRDVLDLSPEERNYLIGLRVTSIETDCKNYAFISGLETRGEPGKQEALRRMEVIARRHGVGLTPLN